MSSRQGLTGFRRGTTKRPIRKSLVDAVVAVVAVAVLVGAFGFAVDDAGLPAAAAAAANAVQTENALPGDPTWDDFASVAQQDAISGYGSSISVNHGQSLDLFVTTTAASFNIDVFRMGWYGGAGARKVTTLGTFPGAHQAIPVPDAVTGMVVCNWQKTTTLNVPSTWVSGVYLAKLSAANGNKSFIFFVVRNDGGTEAVAFQTSVTTYQAYNIYGGVSLYDNLTNKSIYKYPHATKVSFDRPFDPLDNNGSGHFLAYEYPFLRWAEKSGYDMTYITDVDTHTNVNALTNHKAFLSLGHDEYWSKGMRDNVQAAINAGVNAAFFSANSAYWQIRFEPNATGSANRVEVGYKDIATFDAAPGPDPQWNVNNAIVTTRWRDDPVNRPENGLIGVMYQDQVNSNYAYVVQNSANWVYAGTGFVDGSSVPGIVGYEYDKVWNNGASPPGLTVLSNSPVVGCCEQSGSSHANSTLYTALSGARVFGSGTIQWSWGLDNYSATYANAGIQRTTANILNNFVGGPATPAPVVTLSPTSLSFGSQLTGTTSAAQPVILTNSGTAPLTISGFGLTGTNSSDFSENTTCPLSPGTLAAGANCSVNVTFLPTSTGSRSASVTITDNAAGSTQLVPLSGTGTAPTVTLSPTSLSFTSQLTGTTSAAQPVTLTNSGTAPLTIAAIGLTGTNVGDFAQTNTCPAATATLAAGASCTISVTFTPSSTGTRTASLSITDSAGGSPHSVALTATGASSAPVVTLSPTSLSFGSQLTGTTSAAQPVILTNSGTAPLTISGFGLTGTNVGDFAKTNTCPAATATLAAGASCTLSVTFTPSSTGTRTANLSITDNAVGSPQAVLLGGTGTAPALSLSPAAVTFASQATGTTSAAQVITLTNSGTAPLTFSAIGLTGTNAGDFAQTNTCPLAPGTLAAAGKCSISATFTPSSTGTRTANLAVTDNAGGSPHTIALSGTGASPSTALFADGFESGTLPGSWTATSVSSTNGLTLDSVLKHSGTASLKAVQTEGSAGNANVTRTIAGQAALDVRGYYYLSSPVNWGAVQLMSLYGQGNFIGWVSYNVDPSAPSLTVYNGANNALFTCTAVPSLNAWHSIELQYVLSTTTSGSLALWVDGVQACAATAIKTAPASGLTIDQVVAGVDSADNTVGLTAHVDDVVVSKSFIGP